MDGSFLFSSFCCRCNLSVYNVANTEKAQIITINDQGSGYDMGARDAYFKIAASMKSKGFDIKIISECTGLTPEETDAI